MQLSVLDLVPVRSDQSTVDAFAATVRLATNWRVTAGIDNLTDSYPDKTTSVANLNTNGIYPYSNFSPAGFNGRFFYAKVGYSW